MASPNVKEVNCTNSQSTGDETTQDIAQGSSPQKYVGRFEIQNAQHIYRRHRRSNPHPYPTDKIIQYL